MTTAETMFVPCEPRFWNGRYDRVPGDSAVFHLRYHDGRLRPVIVWPCDDKVATCPAVECAAADELAMAVAEAKRFAGGTGGGSFLINEFGQVLVPSSDGDGIRLLAGCLSGSLLFENPFAPEEPIDLFNERNFRNGDRWTLPYVGMLYNLHLRGYIYYYHQDEHGGRSAYPPRQDEQLVQALRRVRTSGPIRFLVTYGGLVLTKVLSDTGWEPEQTWQPIFVGAINRELWFEKE